MVPAYDQEVLRGPSGQWRCEDQKVVRGPGGGKRIMQRWQEDQYGRW